MPTFATMILIIVIAHILIAALDTSCFPRALVVNIERITWLLLDF